MPSPSSSRSSPSASLGTVLIAILSLIAQLPCASSTSPSPVTHDPRLTLIIDLTHPRVTPIIERWSSYRDITRWADQLLDDKLWATPAMTKLRTSLIGTSGIHERLFKDLTESSVEDLEKISGVEGFAGLLTTNATMTLGFEVGMCGGGNTTRKLIIDVGECQDPIEPRNGTLLSLLNTWVPGRGFRSCESACRDAVIRITDLWSSPDQQAKKPTRLALYTPSPISECTAARLHLESNAFGGAPLGTVDKLPAFADDRFALMVGEVTATCPGKMDEALAKLPLLDRLKMRDQDEGNACEKHLDAFEWELFHTVFSSHMNDSESTPSALWPTFSQIFFANTQNEDSTAFHSTFANMSCPTWSSVTVTPNNTSSSIPVLQIQGPELSNVFDLLEISLKMASLNPHTVESDADQDGLEDSLIAAISTLCHYCASFPAVSYAALFGAVEGVERDAVCKQTVVGGLGERLSVQLETVKARLPPSVTVRSGAAEKAGHPLVLKSAILELKDEFAVEGTRSILHFDRCPASATLSLTVEVPKAKAKLTGKQKRKHGNVETVLLTSLRPPGEAFEKVAANVSSLDSGFVHHLDGAVTAAFLTGASPVLEVNVTAGREFFGIVVVSLNVSQADIVQMDSVNVTISCGFSPAVSASLPTTTTLTPQSDSLTDWIEAVGDLKTSNIEIPTRFHAITYDISTRLPTSPYLLQEISFLAGQTPLLFLQSARHFPTSLQLPPALKTRLAITEPCDHGVGGSGPSGLRLVYRTESLDVVGCLEKDMVGLGAVVAETGVGEVPGVILLRERKVKLGVIAINVAWTPKTDSDHARKHRDEMKVLLWIMEHVRVNLGLPMIIAGAFDDDLHHLAIEMMHETGMFRNFYPPEPNASPSHIWSPTLPTSDLLLLTRRDDGSQPSSSTSLVESCLGSIDADDSRKACRDVKEYGRWFRKSVGGVLAEDRMMTKHEGCSSGVSEHLGVGFEVEI
ncbi:hypothetical protein HDU67_009462, partial [Dinochytrium kinnereticum]